MIELAFIVFGIIGVALGLVIPSTVVLIVGVVLLAFGGIWLIFIDDDSPFNLL